jgi:hypothetical protein
MATKRTSVRKKAVPKGDAKPKAAKPVGVETRAKAVKKLLTKVEKKMTEEPIKATLGEYIRLVQLHQELDADEPKEIKVTWVEPEATE